MESIEKWLEQVSQLKDISINDYMTYQFSRDDRRSVSIDNYSIKSPADGIVLYTKWVNDVNDIVNIKGREYSWEDYIVDEEILSTLRLPVLVIGIFMTYLDIHINRMPYSGYLKFKYLPHLSTMNYPMLITEEKLLRKYYPSQNDMAYIYSNERVINTVYNPCMKLRYYMLQVADYQVDSILHFNASQNLYYHQGERFSFIRYGSQVDLLLPFNEHYVYDVQVKVFEHVKAGIDHLIRLIVK